MKKLVWLLMFAGLAHAETVDDEGLINMLSENLKPVGLYLAQTGEDAPHISGDGVSHVFNFTPIQCRGKDCKGLLFSYRPATYEACLRPNLKLGLGEKPVALDNGVKGVFTVPSLTDKKSLTRDFLVFFNKGYCYEMDWGYKGSQYKNAVSLARHVVLS